MGIDEHECKQNQEVIKAYNLKCVTKNQPAALKHHDLRRLASIAFMASVPEEQSPEEETQPEATRVWDVGYDPEGTSEYECLRCGELVLAESHPGDCPQCDSVLRNRSMPFE